jgi:hypothetical protein
LKKRFLACEGGSPLSKEEDQCDFWKIASLWKSIDLLHAKHLKRKDHDKKMEDISFEEALSSIPFPLYGLPDDEVFGLRYSGVPKRILSYKGTSARLIYESSICRPYVQEYQILPFRSSGRSNPSEETKAPTFEVFSSLHDPFAPKAETISGLHMFYKLEDSHPLTRFLRTMREVRIRIGGVTFEGSMTYWAEPYYTAQFGFTESRPTTSNGLCSQIGGSTSRLHMEDIFHVISRLVVLNGKAIE